MAPLTASVISVCFLAMVPSLVSSQDLTIDLKTGNFSSLEPDRGFSWKIPVTKTSDDNGTECSSEGVLQLTFNNSTRKRVNINMEFTPIPYDSFQWKALFQISDSEVTGKFGNDTGAQSNDATIDGYDWGPFIFPNDNSVSEVSDIIYNYYKFWDDKLTINISDGNLTMENGRDLIYILSPRLFALNGQPDLQGPVNYDIFLAMNTRLDNSEHNSGLCKVDITWYDN